MLQETTCTTVVGGHLDFPRYASFAAVKLVLWWEEEFVAAYRRNSGFLRRNIYTGEDNSRACGGMIKSSDPLKFVNLITTSADQLLGRLYFARGCNYFNSLELGITSFQNICMF